MAEGQHRNYFELFDIPVSLQVDKAMLRQKYLALSRQHHPDYFVNESAEAQEEALNASAALNRALKVFNNTDNTIRYVLLEKGLMQEEEKYSLPPDFLMEMMELNEAAEEAADPDSVNRLEQQLTTIENEIYEPVASIVEGYQEGVTSEKELLQVKEYYFKKKYLHRLREQMRQKL
jgi:molecular chaperone HscB